MQYFLTIFFIQGYTPLMTKQIFSLDKPLFDISKRPKKNFDNQIFLYKMKMESILKIIKKQYF